MVKTFILGGGLAGLIAAYYNPEYQVVSSNLGGQLLTKWPLGPRYLHESPALERLLGEINLPILKKEVEIGYYDKEFIEPSIEHFRAYWKKTRGDTFPKEPGFMMRGEDLLEVFETSQAQLCMTLISKVEEEKRWLDGVVHQVDLRKRRFYLQGRGWQDYDVLINTLPAPVFFSFLVAENIQGLLEDQWTLPDLRYKPIDFFYGSITAPWLQKVVWEKGASFSFIYFPRGPTCFYRVTKVEEPYVVFETTRDLPLQVVAEVRVEDHTRLEVGKILDGKLQYQLLPWESFGIRHFGRFARWEDDLMTHHLVEKMQSG